ncbi:hypothetical protein [Streptomyces griseosporeus]|uniref:hypothetical protein n=1 Tax=Streptomyces griseosporeus TaxID=1910 RepID=UPI0036F51A61
MNERPQRPLRPDEEEALARFHNGDTLDNIPVVRPLPPPAPVPTARWPRPAVLVSAALGAAVVGSLVGVGVVALVSGRGQGKTQAEQPHSEVSAGATPASEQATAAPGGSPQVQTPSPADSEPIVGQQAAALEQVRIIQTPATGGDPSSVYCLVYTGSFSGSEKDAILLMNAPAVECHDLLPYDPSGERPPFSTEAPLCEAPSRPAVVSFAETGGWEDEVMYTCLTEHDGA